MAASVLIVEDDALTRRLFDDLLQAQGYATVPVGDGPRALAAARRSRPDLVLLDVQLPGLSGIEVVRALKADPTLAAVPVLAVTAFAMKGDRERLLAAGFAGYLAKPVATADLLAAVAERLGPTRAAG